MFEYVFIKYIIYLAEEGATPWANGKCPESYTAKIGHVHDLLKKFLQLIPMYV